MAWKKTKETEVATAEAFTPDGQVFSDGSVRYKILCDGGINPGGVFWTKTVPAGASTEELQAAQAERDAKVRELAGL